MKGKSCVVIAALFVCGALAPMDSSARLNAFNPRQQPGHHYLEGIDLNTLPSTAKPVVTLSSTSLLFACSPPPFQCTSTQRKKTVTLKNTGNATLRITSIVKSGVNFSEWNYCGSSLSPGTSCTIVVYWSSVRQSSYGTITITDNAANSPQTVSLRGILRYYVL
jgi:hypothetical protein